MRENPRKDDMKADINVCVCMKETHTRRDTVQYVLRFDSGLHSTYQSAWYTSLRSAPVHSDQSQK